VVGGGGSQGSSITSLSLNHNWDRDKWISVDTHTGKDAGRDDASVVDEWLWRRDTRNLKPSDFPVHLEVHRWERDIPVEELVVPLVFIGNESDWFARGTVDERRIEVQARDVSSSELELAAVDPRDYMRPLDA
jgi:hypothetical protein